MSKYFGTPFAESGDKTTIPDAAQAGGEVSYAEGFTVDYELDQTSNPNAKDITRDEFNQLGNDVTGALKDIQEQGIRFYTGDVNYPVSARVIGSDGNIYKCLIANGQSSTVVDPVGDVTGTWISNGEASMQKGAVFGGSASNGSDSDHDIDISKFSCAGKNNSFIASSSVITKAIDSVYVKSAAGGLDANDTLTADTTYHCLAILFDDNVVDWAFTTDLTGASLLTISGAIDVQHLWSVVTDSSSNIINFNSDGHEYCEYLQPILEFSGGSTTAVVTDAITVPVGIKTRVDLNVYTLVNGAHYFFNPDATEITGSVSASPLMTWGMTGATNDQGGSKVSGIMTNELAQIKRQSPISITLRYATVGYSFKRGQL